MMKDRRGSHGNHYRVAVRCAETGEIWESRTAAVHAFGVSIACICAHMRFGEPLKGKVLTNC